MRAIIYYLFLPVIYGISYLPFWFIYRLSDLLFVTLFYVLGYRRKVVQTNLRNSFPEKTNEELKVIERRFYQYFCDLIGETLKTLTVKPSALKKRVAFTGTEVFEEYYKQEQSTVIVMGHWGNWELGGARFALEPFHQLFVIYNPLHNKHFDKLVYTMRSRLGNGLYTKKDSLRGMLRNRDKVTATAFIADQTPHAKNAYWMEFLNQDTPVFRGTGKIATKLKLPVVYIGIRRVRRGYYEMHAEKLVTDPSAVSETDILELFTRRLEENIKAVPEIWLWTHRRWKHNRKGEN